MPYGNRVKEGVKVIQIKYKPQIYQRKIHASEKRFRVVRIGRRGGKTELALNELIKKSIIKPGLYWFVAPTYRQAKEIAWVRLKQLLKVDPSWKFNEQELAAFHRGIETSIKLKGADNEDSLRGVGLQGVVMDECAMMKDNIWSEIIRPMLVDTQGWALFISTPKFLNWFYDICQMEKEDPDNWQSWHYPSTVNDYVPDEEIALQEKEMPSRLFRQEYLAEFIEDDMSVFRGIRQCIVGELKAAVPGRFYVMGVDLAKSYDFTVITVVDSVTREVVYFWRSQDVAWSVQKLKIQEVAASYNNALVVLDSTGVGDPIAEDLQSSNISLYYSESGVPGVKFKSNMIKGKIIEHLVICIEQRMVTFPPDLEELIDELRRYEYEITASGKLKYGAPSGKHDDCVTSLALCMWALRGMVKEAQVITKPEVEYKDRQGQGVEVGLEHTESRFGYGR